MTDRTETKHQNVEFPSGDAGIGAYLCRPRQDGKVPGVIVIHENRGLTDYIRNVTQQLAHAGYAALAVNLCSRGLGPEAPGGSDEAMAALRELTTEQALQDLGAGVDYLKEQPFVQADKIGVVGFCYGGRLSLLLACHRADLSASVIFYGRPGDALPLIPELKAAVSGNFGGEDKAIPTETVRELEAALGQHGITHDIKVFAGAGHAFHRPGGDNFRADAAHEAWQRTIDWFARHLNA